MTPWWQYLIQGLLGLAVVFGSMYAARQAARATMKAAEQSSTVEDKRVDVEKWDSLFEQQGKVVERQAGEIDSLRERLERLETFARDQRDVLQLHAAWDSMAMSELRLAHISHLPDPPPLYPPPHRRTS